MDSKEKRCFVVLLSISFSMMVSGYFFVPFVVNFWLYMANLAGEKEVFLASILIIYFTMVALFGAAIGILINAYGMRLIKPIGKFCKKYLRRQ